MAVNLRSISGTSALPHKVGGRTRRSFNVTNRDENFNTYVVGQDNITGRSIVSDGNGTYQLNQDLGNVRPGDQATLSRSETSEGGRFITATVRQFAGGKLLTYTYKVAAQNPIESDTINDNCDDNNGVSDPGSPPAFPPEAPEPDEPPENFIPPEEEEEEEEEDPVSVPFGCAPDDSAQWFNGSSCPPDTVSLGFAELPDGSVMSLCQGASTPPGDGCPVEPSTYGYSCVDGNCIEKANGSFATLAECQESGCQDVSEEIPINPTMGWENVDGVCQLIPGGSFSTKIECTGEPPFNCPGSDDWKFSSETDIDFSSWGGVVMEHHVGLVGSRAGFTNIWLDTDIHGNQVLKYTECDGDIKIWGNPPNYPPPTAAGIRYYWTNHRDFAFEIIETGNCGPANPDPNCP